MRSEEKLRVFHVALVMIAKVHFSVLNVRVLLKGHDTIVAIPSDVLRETMLGRDDPSVVDDRTGTDTLSVFSETDNPRP